MWGGDIKVEQRTHHSKRGTQEQTESSDVVVDDYIWLQGVPPTTLYPQVNNLVPMGEGLVPGYAEVVSDDYPQPVWRMSGDIHP